MGIVIVVNDRIHLIWLANLTFEHPSSGSP